MDYIEFINKKVIKKSGKPFKSQFKVNIVKDIINHPILNIPAFTFYEDDSYVDCRSCRSCRSCITEDSLDEKKY